MARLTPGKRVPTFAPDSTCPRSLFTRQLTNSDYRLIRGVVLLGAVDGIGIMNCTRSRAIRALGVLLGVSLLSSFGVVAQGFSESLLTTDNGYNPMPSPDGKHIAFVRVGWGESTFVSFGRSSLVSEVKVLNVEGDAVPYLLAKGYFLSGWTPDSVRLPSTDKKLVAFCWPRRNSSKVACIRCIASSTAGSNTLM